MYCSNCGALREEDEKFCGTCGDQIERTTVSVRGADVKVVQKNHGIFHAFVISDDELNLQVLNYEHLPITKSSRGLAVLTLVGLLLLSFAILVVLNLFGNNLFSYSDLLWSLLIYAPLLYFVYRGHVWAIVALSMWYTVDKLYSTIILSPTHFSVGPIIFWMIGIGPLWVAFRVERAYRKRKILASEGVA